MSLRNLQNATDAGNVDNTRGVAFDVSTALIEQAEKSGCHVIDREGIDLVDCSPRVLAVIIEEGISDGLCIDFFWCLGIIGEVCERTHDPGAGKVG